MMIRTAGGPGGVSPIDFHERKTPRFSRTTWIALGVVSAAHVGLGLALYYQRFELPAPAETPEPPTTIIELFTPKPPVPLKPVKTPPAQAPNTVVNTTPAAPTTTDTIAVVQGDKPTTSPSISTSDPAPTPTDGGVATTPAPAQPPAVITQPNWIKQPSGDQLMRAYPARALQAEVEGAATLNCLVQPTGRVTDCAVTRETPGGYGFGRAAQGLSRHFQISPRTVDGAAEGSRVNIALRFNLPEA